MVSVPQIPSWGRFFTALITPFSKDGSVNVNELKRIATYVVDEQQNDGLAIGGSTGESVTLTEDEKLLILDTVLEAVGDRATILLGAGTSSTQESIRLAKAGKEHGAHGLMVVNPAYNKPGQRGLFAHFKAIADSTSLPIMLYNIPSRTSINLEPSTLFNLMKECPNIIAVKESSGNITQIGEVCVGIPEGRLVYSGDDSLALPTMAVGGYGLVSVVGGVVGRFMREMIYRFEDTPLYSSHIHKQLISVFQAFFMAPNPVPIKYATSLQGFNCEDVRLPLVKLTDEEKCCVKSALEKVLLENPLKVSLKP